MENITTTAQLQDHIRLLELRREAEANMIKEEFRTMLESLNPVTIIKKTVKNLAAEPDFKEDVMNMLMGLVTGFISKKIAIGSSHNPIKKLMGYLVQVGVTGIVSKNGNSIRNVAGALINKVFHKKENNTEQD